MHPAPGDPFSAEPAKADAAFFVRRQQILGGACPVSTLDERRLGAELLDQGPRRGLAALASGDVGLAQGLCFREIRGHQSRSCDQLDQRFSSSSLEQRSPVAGGHHWIEHDRDCRVEFVETQ